MESELYMAGGWTRDGGVQDQIDASVEDAVKLVRSRLPDGEGLTHCEQCETLIPAARRLEEPARHTCNKRYARVDRSQLCR